MACCETTTDRSSTNLLDAWLNGSAPTLPHLALIATPHRLIWAYGSDHARASAASAQFKEMRLKVFTPKTADLAARHFCEELKHASDQLSPPAEEKPHRKWLGL